MCCIETNVQFTQESLANAKVNARQHCVVRSRGLGDVYKRQLFVCLSVRRITRKLVNGF